MPRYLVIGANGQLGHDLCPRLPGEVTRAERPRVDLTRPDSLQAAIDAATPDVVINCAAYNFVDRAESEPEAAFASNAFGVRNLARICAERRVDLVHFSSDYVFGLDVARRTPWRETDLPGPISAYGVSKLAGEQFVQALCPRHFIIRSCGLYGAWGSAGKGGNFVETMLKLADQGKPIRVVTDEICTPTYCVDLAEAAAALIATQQYGLYHITNAGECSRFEFAQEIMRQAGKSVQVVPITSREFGAAARRPVYAVLAMDAYERLGLPRMRPWREALAAYLGERNERAQPNRRPGSEADLRRD
jgi:dTDP-4-dehydrorhamnose reductase